MEYNRLAELVNQGISEREMSRKLNCSRGKVSYWMKKHGFTKVNSNNQCEYCKKQLIRENGKFCNSQCQNDFSLMSSINSGIYSAQIAKRYLVRADYRCAVCKNSTWMDKPIHLELDHIDGNSTNNNLTNLRLICPNCHSQTPTYKNRNKGKGRHSRRERYREGKSY
jgi:5-methylcytosine-specific restriction endonuclease McrA